MSQDDTTRIAAASGFEAADTAAPRKLSPEASRALAEAEERRKTAQNGTTAGETASKEVGGRKGLEPTRYGDWEKGGIASDF